MRQKFSITVADIPMNIICDETAETVDAAVAELDAQIRTLTSAAGHSCTKTEAALLSALDYSTRCMHLKERVEELENYVSQADPTGDTYEANLLRGENETLRAQLQVSRGEYDALLQDNATLFQLNAKLVRQNGEANARADRMHDQVLSILTEVRELRERLATMCVETRAPSPTYSTYEEEPSIEITPTEQQITKKYEQMDLDDILNTAPRGARPTAPAAPLLDATKDMDAPAGIADMLDFEDPSPTI
ncbi:MAG: cell division protein ZapA [Clostridia bacterium]|nr:cell division protein ZapA [Clostridia bacterium]